MKNKLVWDLSEIYVKCSITQYELLWALKYVLVDAKITFSTISSGMRYQSKIYVNSEILWLRSSMLSVAENHTRASACRPLEFIILTYGSLSGL